MIWRALFQANHKFGFQISILELDVRKLKRSFTISKNGYHTYLVPVKDSLKYGTCILKQTSILPTVGCISPHLHIFLVRSLGTTIPQKSKSKSPGLATSRSLYYNDVPSLPVGREEDRLLRANTPWWSKQTLNPCLTFLLARIIANIERLHGGPR